MEFDAHILNLFGDETVAQMMERDGLSHNVTVKLTAAKLHELSSRYDVTIRTRSGLTRVFLALQSTFLPGDYGHEQG